MFKGERRPAGAWPLWLIACATIMLGGIGIASAQEIEPGEFVALPPGTNIELGYYVYKHDTSYYTTSGKKVPDSGIEVNLGVERYVHYTELFGHPAGVQLIEIFGSESGAHVGPESLGSAGGAANLDISTYFWPIANPEKKQYLVLATFLYPPVGTYDKNSAVNLASDYQDNGIANGWTGDFQVGWDHGIGDHFSYDAAFDVRKFGDTTGPIEPGIPLSVKMKKDVDFRLQAWLNWQWFRGFTTSIGYEGWFGGTQYLYDPFTASNVAFAKSTEQRLRAAVSMFLSPQTEIVLEVNHDVDRTGGFSQTFGLTLRALYIF